MATAREVLEELRSLGKESFRKTYRRHGAGENVHGVSTADLKTLQKKLRKDGAIAEELWKSGNYDARILATMIADPATLDASTLERWAQELDSYPLTDSFGALVSRGSHAQKLAEGWRSRKSEWIRSAAWNIVAHLAMQESSLPDSWFDARLEEIEKDVDEAQNRVRHEMIGALIAIGVRSDELEKKALAAAKRIGRVEVDHGDTACVTPDAREYIARVKSRRAEKTSSRR